MFQFKLQRILEIRLQNEKNANIYYTNLMLKKENLHNLLIQERDGYFLDRDLWTKSVKEGDLSKQAIFDNAIEGRKRKIMILLDSINSLKEEIQLAEIDLKEAKKKLKIIEKMRDKAKDNYDLLSLKKEKQDMDELGLKKYRQESINSKVK